MSRKQILKWSGDEVMKFLDIYQQHEVLWNV